MIPPSLLVLPPGMGTDGFSTARIQQDRAPSKLACFSLQRVAWSILDCARRTSTFRSCAFREQEDDQATLLLPRVARAQKTLPGCFRDLSIGGCPLSVLLCPSNEAVPILHLL